MSERLRTQSRIRRKLREKLGPQGAPVAVDADYDGTLRAVVGFAVVGTHTVGPQGVYVAGQSKVGIGDRVTDDPTEPVARVGYSWVGRDKKVG